MNGGVWGRIEEEFWAFLKARGFPLSREDLERHLRRVFRRERVKVRVRLGCEFVVGGGGLHIDDVALYSALAEHYGLVEGRDWDWCVGPEVDHYSVFFCVSEGAREVTRMAELYNMAKVVSVITLIRVSRNPSLDFGEVFREEWRKIEEEREGELAMEDLMAMMDELDGDE